MKKNAIILHGTGTKKSEFWFPYLKNKLEKMGFEVWLPQLPRADKPNLAEWLPFVLQHGKFSKETVLIGHSRGAQLILSILEKKKVKQAILVSAYAQSIEKTHTAKKYAKLDWKKIKNNVKNIIFINSDNDPWGCDDKQGQILLKKLGGTLIIPHGEGHMGSTTYKQPYKKFPLLVKLVELNNN